MKPDYRKFKPKLSNLDLLIKKALEKNKISQPFRKNIVIKELKIPAN